MLEIKVTIEVPGLVEALNNLAVAMAGKSQEIKVEPEYTLKKLADAGQVLVEAGKMEELRDLLEKYGVESITALKSEQYPLFASDMIELGAEF